MTTREQLSAAKVDALLRMVSESGASAAGAVPGTDYLDAIRGASDPNEVDGVVTAHRKSNPP